MLKFTTNRIFLCFEIYTEGVFVSKEINKYFVTVLSPNFVKAESISEDMKSFQFALEPHVVTETIQFAFVGRLKIKILAFTETKEKWTDGAKFSIAHSFETPAESLQVTNWTTFFWCRGYIFQMV